MIFFVQYDFSSCLNLSCSTFHMLLTSHAFHAHCYTQSEYVTSWNHIYIYTQTREFQMICKQEAYQWNETFCFLRVISTLIISYPLKTSHHFNLIYIFTCMSYAYALMETPFLWTISDMTTNLSSKILMNSVSKNAQINRTIPEYNSFLNLFLDIVIII